MKNVIIFFVIGFVSASFSEEDVTKYIFDPSREQDVCQEISGDLSWQDLERRFSSFFSTASVSPYLLKAHDNDTTKFRIGMDVSGTSEKSSYVGAVAEDIIDSSSQSVKLRSMYRTSDVLSALDGDDLQIPEWGFCFVSETHIYWAAIIKYQPRYFTALVPTSGTSTETRVAEEPSNDNDEVVTEGRLYDGYVITE